MQESVKAFPEAKPHLSPVQIFPNIYCVTGTVRLSRWIQAPRNMFIFKQGDSLCLVHSVRLNEDGLKELDKLGKVTDLVRIGWFHGMDDPFYLDRYQPTYWGLPGGQTNRKIQPHKKLEDGGAFPIPGSTVQIFTTTKRPEAVVRLESNGGILLTCDAIMNLDGKGFGYNWLARVGLQLQREPAVRSGPLWRKFCEPKVDDYRRIQTLSYRHLLSGHGDPVMNTAHLAVDKLIENEFGGQTT
ncbi:MAG: hypothetical protein KDD39_08010 [Bdellovibrionales bacterium]|nr:hypothetical protein [Bdellovibrionales bacterium]